MDFAPGPLIGAAAGVLALAYGVRSLFLALRRLREQRHLDQAGLVAHAQVTAVEPMQRDRNGAAGQPVTVTFPDQGGNPVHARDDTGLGGYLAREGTPAIVRYSPDNPQLARVEQLVGWHGPYPVRLGSAYHGLSLLGPVLTLAAGALFTVLFGFLAFGDEDRASQVVTDRALSYLPVLFVVVGIGLVIGGTIGAIRRARRGTPRVETTGTVTDVWQKKSGSSKNRTWVYPFTVHFATQDGREVHARNSMASSNFRPQVQQQVRVRYDPARPTRFEVREAGGGAVLVAVPIIIGAAFIVLGSLITAAMFAG